MGRMSMPVHIFEILALAWDHPLMAGLLMLMFTPPFFPVLVFFSPLLISTTLCAVALISVGQFEDVSKREREVAGWNARGGDGDLPVTTRERNTRRRRVPGEDNWLDWVRGDLEPGSVWGQTESSMFIEDVKEERLLADFRVDEGGIDMKEEEFRQQVEAFHEFGRSRNLGERSFSFRTGAALAASVGASLDLPDRDSSMRVVPFQENTTSAILPPSNPEIPPMFHYSLRTAGTGTSASAAGNDLGYLTEAVSRARQTPSHRPREPSQAEQQQKTLISFGSGFISGIFEEHSNADQQPLTQPQPPQQKSLVSFGSGFFTGRIEEPKQENEQQQQQKQLVSFGSGFFADTPIERKDNQRQQQKSEPEPAVSPSSGFMARSVEESENVNNQELENVNNQQQLQWYQHRRSTSPEMHSVSSEPVHSSSSKSAVVAKGSSLSLSPVKSPYTESRESEQHRMANIFDFGGDDRVESRKDRKPKLSHDRSRGHHTYNANLIPGNAVIYTAEPSPIDTRQLQRRNLLGNRERSQGSSTNARQKRNGMAAGYALFMEKENTMTGNSMPTSPMRNAAAK